MRRPGAATGPPARRPRRPALSGTGAGATSALAAVIVAALAGAGLLLHHVHGTRHAAGPAGRHHPVSVASPSVSRPASPPAKSAKVDPCLAGIWRGAREKITNTIGTRPATFTGPGPEVIFRPNGRAVISYGTGTVLRATVNGQHWTETLSGGAAARYRARHGTLQLSHVVTGGSYELRSGDGIDSSGPLSLVESPMRYTCSDTSMQEFPRGGEVDLSRITH